MPILPPTQVTDQQLFARLATMCAALAIAGALTTHATKTGSIAVGVVLGVFAMLAAVFALLSYSSRRVDPEA